MKNRPVKTLKATIKHKAVVDDSAVHDDIWDIEGELVNAINKRYRTR